jgi:transposase
MARGRPAHHVSLSSEELAHLESVVRQKTSPQRDVLRANIALMANAGAGTQAIAHALGVSQQTVTKWRRQAALRGQDGLQEAARPGRPRRITDVARLQLVAFACEVAEPGGRSTPTLDEIRAKAVEQGVVSSLSRSHLHGILQNADLHPHRVQTWLHSPDPKFREKVNVICDLYRKAPVGAVVLSIDEKTGMQAIERKHLDRPPRPGRLRKQEFEYVRHGTQALMAALDVHSGRTLAACGNTRTQADLIAFMEEVAKAWPDQQVHIVWDNLNTHHAGAWVAFNESHGGRFHFHFTPLHASWVNQIELLFGIFSKRVLRNASHTSVGHLKDRTLAWFSERNEAPKPFKWSFRGYHLQTGEPKKMPGRKSDAQTRCPSGSR